MGCLSVLWIFSITFIGGIHNCQSNNRVPFMNIARPVLDANGTVIDIQKDIYLPGNIIFSDSKSLQTFDGTDVSILIDSNITVGRFCQFSSQVVFISGNVLMKLERLTNKVTWFSGKRDFKYIDTTYDSTDWKATHAVDVNWVDGSPDVGVFYQPVGIIVDIKNRNQLIITDSKNNAIRTVDKLTGFISTLYKNTTVARWAESGYRQNPHDDYNSDYYQKVYAMRYWYPQAIIQDSGGDFLISASDIRYKPHTGRGDGPRWEGGRIQQLYKLAYDRSFKTRRSRLQLLEDSFGAVPSGLSISPGIMLYLLNDTLTLYNFETSQVITTLCSGGYQLQSSGFLTRCVLTDAQSLAVDNGTVLIGQQNRIVKVQLWEGSANATSTNGASTGILSRACANTSITAYVPHGDRAADVEVSPDISLYLEPGNHSIVTKDEYGQPCRKQILVVLESEEERNGYACLEPITEHVLPETGLATIDLSSHGLAAKLQLPPGTYHINLTDTIQNCSVKIEVSDFDENVLRQLVFTASYDLKCDAIQQGGFGTNLQTVAEHNFKQIEELCQADCNRGTEADMFCTNDTLVIKWPTDITYGAGVTAVPVELKHELEARIATKGAALYIVMFSHMPPVVYPERTKNGGYASVKLNSFCKNGDRYEALTDKCVKTT